jgi:membrane-associated protease RseP (regulator of RpoE activity)
MSFSFWFIFISVFILGTIALARTKKFERHFILFLIRTKIFLSIIDKIAGISHWFWKFFADVAIVFSFSGLGVTYLSKYRNLSKNLDIILLISGLLGIVFFSIHFKNVVLFLLLFVGLCSLIVFLRKIKNPYFDFIISSLILSYLWFIIFSLLVTVGLIGEIFDSFILLFISCIAGIFGIPGLVILSFLYQGYLILFQSLNVPGVSPFIPATKEGKVGLVAPGTGIFIPIWYALLGIIITVIFHEFAHGILARVHKINLKSTGIVTLGILPIGAFVEPDEKELDKGGSLEKMRVFSVGSFSNFIIAIISFSLLLFSPLILGQYISDGITVIDTQEGYPAFNVLQRGMVIYSINEKLTRNVDEFKNVISEIKPNEEITLKTNSGEIKMKTSSNPSKPDEAYIGIILTHHMPSFIHRSLFWIFFINLSISLVNLLPVIPLDGGRMLKELILIFNFKKVTTSRIFYGVITFILLLIIINIFPLFNMLVNFLTGLVL